MGLRRKARECALQMLFAADVSETRGDELVRYFWNEISDAELDDSSREFATRLATGTLSRLEEVDERIRSRAEHWRIERMAIVDRNVLRLAVYEFLFEPTPYTVTINEALEIARRFSTFEATQFINGILDAIKHDLQKERPDKATESEHAEEHEKSEEEDDEEDDEEEANEQSA
jgi:N utilization substance protein B